MAYDLIDALMLVHDATREEAKAILAELVERVELGEDPEAVLFDEGLEPDYVFDLIDHLA